jgi:hypothetical protein
MNNGGMLKDISTTININYHFTLKCEGVNKKVVENMNYELTRKTELMMELFPIGLEYTILK